MEAENLTESAIEQALEAARNRVLVAEQERTRLEREVTAAREEQRLLQRLLALRRNGSLESSNAQPGKPDADAAGQLGTGEGMLRLVVEELEAAGKPIHISEIMRILNSRGVRIPGSGGQANVISYLRRDPRIVRPTRGMYALTTSGLQDMAAPRRKRRRRRRMHFGKPKQGVTHDH